MQDTRLESGRQAFSALNDKVSVVGTATAVADELVAWNAICGTNNLEI